MGTLVTSKKVADTKPQYAVETVAAAAVAVVDGELAVFIGTVALSQVAKINGIIKECRQALREAKWPNPVTLEFSAAVYTVTTGALAVTNGAHPTLTENDVAVIQGFDFSRDHYSNSTTVVRLTEKGLEDVLKAA